MEALMCDACLYLHGDAGRMA